MASGKSKAVVWGAGGFVGAELLRLILGHPLLELEAALSETHAGRPIADVLPNLSGHTGKHFEGEDSWDRRRLQRGNWTLFACLPHGRTMLRLGPVLDAVKGSDTRVIDLSGDFRLRDAESYRRFYGVTHARPECLKDFVYGLPELNRDRIRNHSWIANPGCLATGAQLAILPLAASPLEVMHLALDGKTGSSGAGIQPRPTTHHPLRANNFRAYKVGRHQHFPEIEAGWRAAGGDDETAISFVSQMAPLVRGIFTTAHVLLRREAPDGVIEDLFGRYYENSPMVRIVRDSPTPAEVWGSNRCDISVHAEGRQAVICTAIDNLVKGAAGQAVQNANLSHGWPEQTGLTVPAPWPV